MCSNFIFSCLSVENLPLYQLASALRFLNPQFECKRHCGRFFGLNSNNLPIQFPQQSGRESGSFMWAMKIFHPYMTVIVSLIQIRFTMADEIVFCIPQNDFIHNRVRAQMFILARTRQLRFSCKYKYANEYLGTFSSRVIFSIGQTSVLFPSTFQS